MLLYMLIMFLVTSISGSGRNYGLCSSARHTWGRRLLRLQGRIQDMVVQSVRDGVLVVSGSGRVRAINQAAQMLHMPQDMPVMGKPLKAIAQILLCSIWIWRWGFAEGEGASSEVFLFAADGQSTHLMVHCHLWPSASSAPDDEPLCLLYLQDMQEVQNQMRQNWRPWGACLPPWRTKFATRWQRLGRRLSCWLRGVDQPLQQKAQRHGARQCAAPGAHRQRRAGYRPHAAIPYRECARVGAGCHGAHAVRRMRCSCIRLMGACTSC